jgi:hypothetical protein
MAGRHSRRRRWQGPRARVVIPAQREPRPLGMTDALTRVEHLVSDESVASHRHTGNYLAFCGQHVLAAS